MATKMKMKWTATMISMVEQADVMISGRRVLSYNDNGQIASDELKVLTAAIALESGIKCHPRAVSQKCRFLRKRTTMKGKRKRNTKLSAHQVEAQEPAQPVEPVEPVEPVPRPVTGGKTISQMVNKRLNDYVHQQKTKTVQVEAQEPVEPVEEQVPMPRPVNGGKGIRVRSMLRRRARRAEEQEVELVAPQQVEKMRKNREEKRAAARIERDLEQQQPGAMKNGLKWDDNDCAKVVEWYHDNMLDASNRNSQTVAMLRLATQLGRSGRATFDKFEQARNDEYEANSGVVMPQVPATNKMVAHSTYYEEKEKTYEQELLEFMQTNPRQMSHSNGAAAVSEARAAPDFVEVLARGDVLFPNVIFVEMPRTSDDGLKLTLQGNKSDSSSEEDCNDRYTEEEIRTIRANWAADQANRTKTSAQELTEQMGLCPMLLSNGAAATAARAPFVFTSSSQLVKAVAAVAAREPFLFPSAYANLVKAAAAEAGAAAGSSGGAVSTGTHARDTMQAYAELVKAAAAEAGAAAGSSGGAVSTGTHARDTMQDSDLIAALTTVAYSRPRHMSPSNGAAATAVNDAPQMLAVEAITNGYMCHVFGVPIDRGEYEIKLKATLTCFHEMERLGVISVRFGEERSIFGMTDIVVKDQGKWIEMMTSYAKMYTKAVHMETKDYQASIYHNFLYLGFNPIERDDDAWKATGRKKIHIHFHTWHYTQKSFQKNKGRFIGR